MHSTRSMLFIKCDVQHVFVVFRFVHRPCPCLFTFVIFEMKRRIDFVVIIDHVNCYYLIFRLIAITDRSKTVDKIAVKRFRFWCQHCQLHVFQTKNTDLLISALGSCVSIARFIIYRRNQKVGAEEGSGISLHWIVSHSQMAYVLKPVFFFLFFSRYIEMIKMKLDCRTITVTVKAAIQMKLTIIFQNKIIRFSLLFLFPCYFVLYYVRNPEHLRCEDTTVQS